ncbi:hypothetical protein DID78_05915 [Candidatus Marinamargulisbacteria bacterium SCGC AG-343-D04]|nr:hypothetical protein DID78_05915 [Candidatus Marinamargulisbacteria bacterium SCGC AG-343-D04]
MEKINYSSVLENTKNHSFFISFTDISLLLLVFFIYLFSISTVTPNKVKTISIGIQKSLGLFNEDTSLSSVTESESLNDSLTQLSTPLDNELLISLSQDILFVPGSAKIKEKGKQYLKKLALLLKKQHALIIVEGHTDNTPINTSAFPSNWHLSAVRASAVAKILNESGVHSKYLKATGYGASRPILKNTSAIYKAQNRRVEIYIKPL